MADVDFASQRIVGQREAGRVVPVGCFIEFLLKTPGCVCTDHIMSLQVIVSERDFSQQGIKGIRRKRRRLAKEEV